jgi:N-acetylgalactosamine kinase
MRSRFIREFGRKPEWEAHAPGRVNLIGEHTDYNGCPVLPMALERDFTAHFSSRDDGKIRFHNLDPLFPPRIFETAGEIKPYETGDWGNYCKAGVQAMTARAERAGGSGPGQRYRGMDVLLSGRIPPAAGLSSSSALVVISALMFNAVNGIVVPFPELAGILAEGEQYVGTKGGGMDQAASLLSEEGKALKIDFYPFGYRTVDMPGDCTVIVADTLVQAPKTRETMDKYNLRTIECALGVELLNRAFAERAHSMQRLRLLGDITEENLGMHWDGIWKVINETLHPNPYSVSELAAELATPAAKIREEFFARKDGSMLPEPEEGLKIRSRVTHILEERVRVEASAAALEKGDLVRFGELMVDSHRSCRDLYEISCPELDRLASDLRASGALGARLTGAGFGGCAIGLTRDRDAEEIIEEVKKRYYRDYLGAEERAAVFPCKPGSGARVSRL